jgi:hypothetical protein
MLTELKKHFLSYSGFIENGNDAFQCNLCQINIKLNDYIFLNSDNESLLTEINNSFFRRDITTDQLLFLKNTCERIYCCCKYCQRCCYFIKILVKNHLGIKKYYLTQLNTLDDCCNLILRDVRYRYILPYDFFKSQELELFLKLIT